MSMTACALALCLAAVTVTDGDTLRSGDLKLRLWGIDAPEKGRPGGMAARNAMRELVEGQALACKDGPGSPDRYGRRVVQCYLPDGRDLACAMVATGHAKDWPKYSGGAFANCAPPSGPPREPLR